MKHEWKVSLVSFANIAERDFAGFEEEGRRHRAIGGVTIKCNLTTPLGESEQVISVAGRGRWKRIMQEELVDRLYRLLISFEQRELLNFEHPPVNAFSALDPHGAREPQSLLKLSLRASMHGASP